MFARLFEGFIHSSAVPQMQELPDVRKSNVGGGLLPIAVFQAQMQ
ncbi:hypothetical protein C4J92_2295 [Pseudomonas sp. R3-18-08]|nr:hypothetical protein C4J92_2295 [Pseudomonas sp. R3-18-08]